MVIKEQFLSKLSLQEEVATLLSNAPELIIPENRKELLEIAVGRQNFFQVGYEVPGKGWVLEAEVVRCKNGLSINYVDPYIRRRDPDCMVVADQKKTDKPRYKDTFGSDFTPLRTETFHWLSTQSLLVFAFLAGGEPYGYPALIIAPSNAGFFAGGLADLQGFLPPEKVPERFTPRAIIYVAPPFRHTHFKGKQIVVHHRTSVHEIFSYNLYPGPSAKKGIYGVLLTIGEQEGWITLHGSTVRSISPYENIVTIMHEGASGGGKSEMIEQMHKELDGRILVGENLKTGDKLYLKLSDSCELMPITDDMALCHPKLQNTSGKLVVKDAEQGWFLRINHITHYGTDPFIEKLTIHPPEPLIFLNLDGVQGATCLIWEHTMDAPGKRCPNPRVIMPRRFVPGVVNEPVEVDVRSFGVRTPPCTREHPTYGIIGMFHVLPPALAWLWRLVAPRGHDNPSITETAGLSSEGVGSYWPFATGSMVDQANLLLQQILETPETKYLLIPNQHIGAFRVSFMPQWLTREYITRRGGVKFRPEQITPARCTLLGYVPKSVRIQGVDMPIGLLQVEQQIEVGEEAYDRGAKILEDFFQRELKKFLSPELHLSGRLIIECFMDKGSVADYESLLPHK
ncbi:MAG: DUF4914 family protein [Spirochaetes bacterium]|nr:DUF4914 family protein [Spirochaetota bacterium]